MKHLWRKKSEEESQLWHEEVERVKGQQYFILNLFIGTVTTQRFNEISL
jgi:hypothetical protein